jgi:glucose-6-phosphate-specific signal transduction histidine kinase
MIQIIVTIINFIAVLIIYKTAFKVGWRAAFVISILAFIMVLIFNQNLPIIFYDIAFLTPIFGPVTWGMFTVNTPVGEMAIYIDEIIELFILGLILSTILIYLIAELLNINISFLRTLIANIFPGMVSFIIIIISFLSSMLENSNVAFFIGVAVAFIAVSIIYRYIPNVNWKKAILMSIIVSVLWFIIGVFKLPDYIYFMICC